MYASVYVLTILYSLFKVNFGFSENLPSCVFDACERITDPEYLQTSCCPQMDKLAEVVKECKGFSPYIETCSQATCVVERYGVLTKGEVDFKKAGQAIIDFDAAYPDTVPLNALVKKYCLRGNYTCFPAEDPECWNWKFLNCVFFAYRIGCPITYSDCECDDIAEDVLTCKPYQRKYVRELNKGCSNCVGPLTPPVVLPLRENVYDRGFVESRVKFIE